MPHPGASVSACFGGDQGLGRSWLEPTFIDPVSGRLVLCVQSFVIKTPRHNILIDSCVGNHKPRPARPFWNMMNSDRFETASRPPGSR